MAVDSPWRRRTSTGSARGGRADEDPPALVAGHDRVGREVADPVDLDRRQREVAAVAAVADEPGGPDPAEPGRAGPRSGGRAPSGRQRRLRRPGARVSSASSASMVRSSLGHRAGSARPPRPVISASSASCPLASSASTRLLLLEHDELLVLQLAEPGGQLRDLAPRWRPGRGRRRRGRRRGGPRAALRRASTAADCSSRCPSRVASSSRCAGELGRPAPDRRRAGAAAPRARRRSGRAALRCSCCAIAVSRSWTASSDRQAGRRPPAPVSVTARPIRSPGPRRARRAAASSATARASSQSHHRRLGALALRRAPGRRPGPPSR